MSKLLFFSALLIFTTTRISLVTSEPIQDKQALINFLNNITHSHSLNWNISTPLCTSWTGITCNKDQSSVIALRLPGMSLRGLIPPNTLSRLSELRILSLRSNGLQGSIPADFSNLRNLSAIYLQSNRFSGPLFSEFAVWKNLSVIDLSNNEFNESIPSSISSLTGIISLNLANNSLTGEIPDFDLPGLQNLNLSNNKLSGTLPKSLQRFPRSAFAGNNLSFETATPPALPLHSKGFANLTSPAILATAISGCVLFFVLVALLIIICHTKKLRKGGNADFQSRKETSKNKRDAENITSEEEKNKIAFFEGSNLVFDLEDLLRASAEVLGKGVFGATYKAALEDASNTTVVVKRFKEVSVPRRDFEQQMEIVGRLNHENVTPVRAYFCSKDEKLMVYDYYEHGSLNALLHGSRGENHRRLDWEARLKIAIGTARGIAYIHNQNAGKLVHGNIKSSNIFLNSTGHGLVSETGLAILTNAVQQPGIRRLSGYLAPEVTDTRKSTQASDMYGFGVLLLEILTGKSPTGNSAVESVSLVRWVNSVVREEWTAEVFDLELLRYPNIEEEMVEILQIGMSCTVRIPEKRPRMEDVVKRLEEIRMNRRSTVEIRSGASPGNSAPMPETGVVGPSSVP